ncbi:calmodulin [Stylonychia lemnae]|uniref:Calmodulin n=1 Tax=Stylonychia lemnae TaxID=5949 RepID=A0A078ARW9_STYLE|nr:calmodulin [Stylonychia lemnae]|eukprot:CDW83628.1 calmodulin [Stylonychia lemnae]
MADLRKTEIKEIFDLFDKNQTGRVHATELGTIVRALNLNPTETEIVDMIKRIDPQGSGSFGLPQLEELIRESEKNKDVDALKDLIEALQVFDSDHDGILSVDEFKQAMMTMGEKMQEHEIDEIINDSELVINKQIRIDHFANLIINRI